MKSAREVAIERECEAKKRQSDWASRAFASVLATVYLAALLLPFHSVRDYNRQWKTTYGYELLTELPTRTSESGYLLLCCGLIWITNLFLVSGLVALLIPNSRTAFILGVAAISSGFTTSLFAGPFIGIGRVIAAIFDGDHSWGLAGPCWFIALVAVPFIAGGLGSELWDAVGESRTVRSRVGCSDFD